MNLPPITYFAVLSFIKSLGTTTNTFASNAYRSSQFRRHRVPSCNLCIHFGYCLCKVSFCLWSLYLFVSFKHLKLEIQTSLRGFKILHTGVGLTLKVGVRSPFSKVNGSGTKVTALANSNPLNYILPNIVNFLS